MNRFKTVRIRELIPVACILGLSCCAFGEDKPAAAVPDSKLPPGKEVIAKFIRAIGGEDAILKHASMVFKGKWEMPGMAQGGDFELIRAKPNKQLLRIKLGDQGQILNGYDGKVGWMLSPFTGAMLVDGKLLDQTIEEADFYNILHREPNYKSLETVGTARMDGKDCVELKVVTKSGREVREFYDAKTGLLVATKSTQESPQGPNQVTLTFSNYQKMSDLLQATRLQVKAGEFEQVITISSVEYDSAPDKEFDLPAEIKALLKK